MIATATALAAASVAASPQPPPPADTFRIGTTGASAGRRIRRSPISRPPGSSSTRPARSSSTTPTRRGPEHEVDAPGAGDRGRPCRRSPRTGSDVHVPDPQRLCLLAAGVGRGDGPEHEVHVRANAAAPNLRLAGAAGSARTSSATTAVPRTARASEITGIVAQGDTLTFHLIEPQGEFLTFLAMPFALRRPDRRCRASSSSRRFPPRARTTSLGYAINEQITATRNPNYHGPRPRRFDTLEYLLQPERGDGLPAGAVGRAGLRPASGRPMSVEVGDSCTARTAAAAARGLQQFFPDADQTALGTSR